VAPLLTGFSLATIAVLVTASRHPPQSSWAIVFLTVAVCLFLYAMQISFMALARSPSPSDFLAWVPEIAHDDALLAEARTEQAATFDEMQRFWKIAGLLYDFALDSFLMGVVLLLVPHTWSLVNGAPVAAAGIALFVELWWTAANRCKGIKHPAFVRRPTCQGQRDAHKLSS
jgi:hypothetical protein